MGPEAGVEKATNGEKVELVQRLDEQAGPDSAGQPHIGVTEQH